jgi:hypothetical protein
VRVQLEGVTQLDVMTQLEGVTLIRLQKSIWKKKILEVNEMLRMQSELINLTLFGRDLNNSKKYVKQLTRNYVFVKTELFNFSDRETQL